MKTKSFKAHDWAKKPVNGSWKRIPLTMQLLAALVTTPVGMVTASEAYAQTAVISISAKKMTVGEVLEQIKQQSDFEFFYNNAHLDLNRRVDVSDSNKDVFSLLESVFEGTNVNYKVVDKSIILTTSKGGVVAPSQAKKIDVKGRILDINGEPVIGATVMEKGTTNGTITDFDGNFVINVAEGATMEFSYIGYKTMVMKAAKVMNITMKEDTETLDEVVVVGYGTQKKVNLTGAVESVDSDVLADRPIRSATDALQGAVSGLTVTSGTGQPGQFASFKIRGNTSVNSAGALVIIDGLPGDLNSVNPQDIESISVLKDAASAAIYGARAAEGVVLVTTRSGKSEKVKVEYSGNVSFNKPTRLPESNTGLNHALLSNVAFTNAGLAVQFPENAIEALKDPAVSAIPNGRDWIYTDNMDWIGTMMDHSFQQNHNLTVSKASNGLKYLFSAGWLDQNGLFAEYGPDNFDRINLRSNVSVDLIKDKLTLDSKITYVQNKQLYHPQFGGWSIPYITFIQAGPNMPVYDPNGNYARYRMQANPIQALREGGEASKKMQSIEGVFTLSYKPVKGLTLKAVGGASVTNGQNKEFRRQYGKYGCNGLISMGAGQAGPSRVDQSSYNKRYVTGQLLAEYNLKLKQHTFNLLGGWSAEENLYEDLGARRTDIVGNQLPALGLGSTDGWSNRADETEWALLSGFMRFNYDFADKYLFEANFRADASSRFSKKNRWGVFPSFSAGWRITQEDFMQNQKVFSNLKLRASWGQLGNQNGLGLYDHIAQYSFSGYYPFASGLGQWASVKQLPSEERTWETVEMTNFALEMGFLDNRLNVTAEYFIKRNKDMLVNVEVPSVIGISVPTSNYGELEVKGWDLSIGWNDRIGDFNYSARFNLSDQKDKLVDYGVEYNGFTAGVNQRVQGYSLGSIFGYKTDGYFQTQEEVDNYAVINRSVVGPGDIKYVDKDNDGKISAPNDLEYLGTTNPRFVYGLSLNASWHGWDFGAVFQGVGKRNFYLAKEIMAPFSVTWGNFSYKMHNDYWTPENPNAALPRHYAGSSHNYQISDHWVQNAAYFRMKNLQLGYTFPKAWTEKIHLEKLRLYFSGENVFEISKLNKNFDPELTDISGFIYPIMRNFSFGVNLSF